jgi:hypothetical protein
MKRPLRANNDPLGIGRSITGESQPADFAGPDLVSGRELPMWPPTCARPDTRSGSTETRMAAGPRRARPCVAPRMAAGVQLAKTSRLAEGTSPRNAHARSRPDSRSGLSRSAGCQARFACCIAGCSFFRTGRGFASSAGLAACATCALRNIRLQLMLRGA